MIRLISLACCAVVLGLPAWARPPQDLEEASRSLLFVRSFNEHGGVEQRGVVFPLADGEGQWLVGNARQLVDARRIEIRDSGGELVLGFGPLYCLASGQDFLKVPGGVDGQGLHIRFGTDGFRIALREELPVAFELVRGRVEPGAQVVMLCPGADADGIEERSGKLVGVGEGVAVSDIEQLGLDTGGVMLDPATLRVIGLRTFGASATRPPMESLWMDKEAVAGELPEAATLLRGAAWKRVEMGAFIEGARRIEKFTDLVKILSLVYKTTPTEHGFKVRDDVELVPGVYLYEAFENYKRDPVTRPLVDLNDRMERMEFSELRVSNMEVVSVYARSIRAARQGYHRTARRLIRELPPYFPSELERLGVFQIGNFCAVALEPAEDWFTEKAGAGGSMPVGRWIELPSIEDFDEAEEWERRWRKERQHRWRHPRPEFE